VVVETMTISGYVVDEPISGATVKLLSLDNEELKTAITDSNGSYSLEVGEDKVANGFMLEVTGGSMNGEDFNGILRAIYGAGEDFEKANVTLITTLVAKMAMIDGDSSIEKRDLALQKLSDMGMIQLDDWFKIEPSMVDSDMLHVAIRLDGLDVLLNNLLEDLNDDELSNDNHPFFATAHGGINRIFISPVDSVSLFAGQVNELNVSSTFLDNNESNITVTKVSGPSWATVNGRIINISPPETETNFTTYTLSIEASANGVRIGRKKDITISLLKPVILVEGELGTAGGRIENEWKDISISVDNNQLDKSYAISLIAGMNNKGEVVKFYKIEPEMSDEYFDKLNINMPSIDIIKQNYLLNNDINRNLKNRAEDKKRLNPCIEDWIDRNEDGFKFDKIWDFNEADFIMMLSINGYPRKTIEKEKVPYTISECAWTLRSSEYKFLFDKKNEGEENYMLGKTPVLFIHGFIRSGNLGGFDDKGEYFGHFPRLSKELGFVPFEFDWRTNANFREVADDLGRAISMITEKTGKKVHIVAHSFGGLLIRTLLQGMALKKSNIYTKEWAEKNILSVTTVGTPHQGIMGKQTGLNFDDGGDITFPKGRHGLLGEAIEVCMAVTCDQVGEEWWNLTELGRKYVGLERPSEFLYKLTKSLSKYPNIKTQVLMGVLAENFRCKKTENKDKCTMHHLLRGLTGIGDGLIQLASQRIAPDLGIAKDTIQNEPSTSFSINSNIEEHLLGFIADTYDNFTVGYQDNIFSILSQFESLDSIESYLKTDIPTEWVEGYVHAGSSGLKEFEIEKDFLDFLGKGHFFAYRMNEVGIDNCKNITKTNIGECRHATWNYFRKFVEVPGEEVLPNNKIFAFGKVFQNGGIPEQPYVVKVYVNNEYLDEKTITGTSDYSISVEFRGKTDDSKYMYHVEVIPINSNLRANSSNIIETDTTIEKSKLSFNDILLVDTKYEASEISIDLKDATENVELSDFDISVYDGNNLIVSGHTDNMVYSTNIGLGDYTCVATKTGYKASIPIPCYSKKDETTSYTIRIYSDEAVGIAIKGSFSDPQIETEYNVKKVGLDTSTGTLKLALTGEGNTQVDTTFPFIWIANSGEGTISKLDTRTGNELGRYRTSEGNGNPSRTTVDKEGNVWVGNRSNNTITKIGLSEWGQCIDKNKNGVIDTSQGATDIKNWGEDECLLLHIALAYNGVDTPSDIRLVAIDKDNNVFAGGRYQTSLFKVNGATGEIIGAVNTLQGHYGGVVDKYGNLWSMQYASGKVQKITNNMSTKELISLGHKGYGIAIDKYGKIWTTEHGSIFSTFDPADPTATLKVFDQTDSYYAQGIACDGNGDIFIAGSSSQSLVGHYKQRFSADGTFEGVDFVTNYAVGQGPIGVAVDSQGKVWSANYHANSASRIDPITGEVANFPAGATPYNYSDMTGNVVRNITTRQGTWEAVFDGKELDFLWNQVTWRLKQALPVGTMVKVFVKVSNSNNDWGALPYIEVANGARLSNSAGQYAKLKVELSSENLTDTPEVIEILLQ